MKEIDLIIRN